VTGTPGAGGPDLAIGVVEDSCQPGTPLVVTVRNAGTTSVNNRVLRITVSTQGGVQGLSSFSISLDPGASINLPTNQLVQLPRTTARIDLIGTPSDVNSANNTVDCVGSGTATPQPATPTRTPRN
jgi:hypothetical protein